MTRSTKHSLIWSALSLLLCVSMLIGSTFAWFTDSVTSTNNKIKSGTLLVDLELFNGTSYESIKNSQDPIFDYDKWEPGFTDVKLLKVENEGTLALKWVANFVADGEVSDLANVIDVFVKPSASALAKPNTRDLIAEGYTRVGTLAEFINTISSTTYGTLEAGDEAYLGIALKMQETAGNEYQDKSIGTAFDIQILATQLASEFDSFDETYDELATYPTGAFIIKTIKNEPAVVDTTDNSFFYANDEATFEVSGTAAAGETPEINIEHVQTPDYSAIADDKEVASYDIEVTGYEPGTVVTVKFFIGKNLADVKLYHEGVAMAASEYSYNSIDGFVTVEATSFSVYTVEYNNTAAEESEYPVANVEEIVNLPEVNGVQLVKGYTFTATETAEEATNSPYKYYHADFVISFDKDVASGSLGIAGQYASFSENWLAFDAFDIDETDGIDGIPADREIRLLYEVGTAAGYEFPYINYEELCSLVKVFNCGAYKLTDACEGTTITVELRLYETQDPTETLNSVNFETGNYSVAGQFKYTF